MTGRSIRQRQARATASYEVAQRAGLSELVQRFGLSASQFADNVHDQYLRHDVDQCPMLPLDAAGDFLTPQFPTTTAALAAARYILAFQISREPFVRRMMRQMFKLQAVISVEPTERGMKELDESHPLFAFRYLKAKPATDLFGSVIFLHIDNVSMSHLLSAAPNNCMDVDNVLCLQCTLNNCLYYWQPNTALCSLRAKFDYAKFSILEVDCRSISS